MAMAVAAMAVVASVVVTTPFVCRMGRGEDSRETMLWGHICYVYYRRRASTQNTKI